MDEHLPLPEGTTLRQVNTAFEDIADTAYNPDVAREAEDFLRTLEVAAATAAPDEPLDPVELSAFRDVYRRLLEHKNDE